MLLTNKADILDAMNKELANASASSVKWLADTFNVPPVHKSKRRVTVISNKTKTVHYGNIVNTGYGPKDIRRKYAKGKRVVFLGIVSSSNEHYVIKLYPEDMPVLEEQNKAFHLPEGKKKYLGYRRLKKRQHTE